MHTIRVGSFTPSVLLEVARRSGALDRAGLEVIESAVPSSPAQFRSLADGELDLAITNPDNVIAYRYIADNPLGTRLDALVVAALDRGLGLTLCARPGLDGIAALERPVLGVDAATSGFGLLAYALLENRGFARDRLRIEQLGSTPLRARALLAGECDVTMLNAGNELTAVARGATIVGGVEELGPYLGTVLVRMASSPADAGDELAACLLGVAARIARRELDPEVTAAAETVLGLDPELARAHLEVLVGSTHGLVPDGRVDAESIENGLELRARLLPDPGLADARSRWPEMLAGAAAGA